MRSLALVGYKQEVTERPEMQWQVVMVSVMLHGLSRGCLPADRTTESWASADHGPWGTQPAHYRNQLRN